MQNVSYSGQWWLPDNPERLVAGIFTFSSSTGGQLELIGTFRIGDEPYPAKGCYPVIMGLTTKGEEITLQESFISNESNYTRVHAQREFRAQTLAVNYAFIGAHFDSLENIRFSNGFLELDFLRDWLATKTVEDEHVPTEDGNLNLRVTYLSPSFVDAKTTKGTVAIEYGRSVSHHVRRGVEVEERLRLRINSVDEMGFRDWHSHFIYPLQTFLTLATGKWSSVRRLQVGSKEHMKPHLKDQPILIETYFPAYERDYPRDEWISPLFTYGQIKDDFDGIIERWLLIVEKYRAPCELFFAVLLTPQMYLEHQFLNLVQAAESFHRIRSAATGTHLRVRIGELVDDVRSMVSGAIGDKDEFIKKIVDSRNYYTHRNQSQSEQAEHGSELRELTESLQYLIHAVLLRELDLPPDVYQGMFARNSEYINFRSRRRR